MPPGHGKLVAGRIDNDGPDTKRFSNRSPQVYAGVLA